MTQHLRFATEPTPSGTIPGIERAITVSAAATEMGADESTVRKLLKDKKLRGYRLGKRGVRIYVNSIREYQEHQTLGETPAGRNPTRQAKGPPTPAHREAVAALASLGIIGPRFPR